MYESAFSQLTLPNPSDIICKCHGIWGFHGIPIWLCSLPLAWLAHTSQSIRHYLHSTYRSHEPIAYHAYTHMGTLWYTNMAMFSVPVLSSPHFPIHQTLFLHSTHQWPQPIAHHAYGGLHDIPIWLCSLSLACLAYTSQSIRHYLHSTHQWPEPIAHHAYTHMGDSMIYQYGYVLCPEPV